MPSWTRGFVNAIHALREGHEIDRMIAANIATEANEDENSGKTQSSSTSGAVVLYRENTSGTHTSIDEEAA